ncbi:MAG: hypothetical protein K6T49_02855 [Acidobacterium ailaaui]|jgi:hypothetical protein|nr:hypothetical protein [Pseudacidobacterium ailaaui]
MRGNRAISQMESDAATRRDLENMAYAIRQFRAAVWHIAEQEGPRPTLIQLEQAARRRRSAQRRIMLEWAFAALAGVAVLLPAAGHYRHHAQMARMAEQQQALKQREADAELLDQVADEVSEAVPDAMRPLAELDSLYGSDQSATGQREKNNARN